MRTSRHCGTRPSRTCARCRGGWAGGTWGTKPRGLGSLALVLPAWLGAHTDAEPRVISINPIEQFDFRMAEDAIEELRPIVGNVGADELRRHHGALLAAARDLAHHEGASGDVSAKRRAVPHAGGGTFPMQQGFDLQDGHALGTVPYRPRVRQRHAGAALQRLAAEIAE